MPSGARASTTAFMIGAVPMIVPDSPTPLAPIGRQWPDRMRLRRVERVTPAAASSASVATPSSSRHSRLASSVREGWCPATEALERFGVAARGDLVHTAGDALGKLLRTLYLCDYLGSPALRRGYLAAQ